MAQNRGDVPDCYYQKPKTKRSTMATVPSVLGRGRISNSRGKFSPYFGTRIRKDLEVEKGTIPSEKVSLPVDSPAWQQTHVDFS